MIRFYTLFSLPDKISNVFRVFFAKFDILATLSHFLRVIRTNPCRWKCKNRCYNKICEKICSGDQWSPEFEKIAIFQILAKIVAPPVARSVIFDKIDRMKFFTRPCLRGFVIITPGHSCLLWLLRRGVEQKSGF